MKSEKILPLKKIKKIIYIPYDKSITHRSLIFSVISKNKSVIINPLKALDTLSTLKILTKLDCKITEKNNYLEIIPPKKIFSLVPLDCGNSGTTARLMIGMLSSLKGSFQLIGDDSLSKRPMKRIIEPILKNGGEIISDDNFLPIIIKGKKIKKIEYDLKIASAQVKSGLILCGLNCKEQSIIRGRIDSRDHTERILSAFNCDLQINSKNIIINPSRPKDIVLKIPGDFSSASFFITLGVLHKNAEIILKNIGLNPSRTGYLNILKKMGADIEINLKDDIEPYGDIKVKSSKLKNVNIPNEIIPNIIDEIPLLSLCGALSQGEFKINDISELRLKESDRIRSITENFKNIGLKVIEKNETLIIKGDQKIKGGIFNSFKDHRIAMLGGICGLLSEEGVEIKNSECVNISFPNFFDIIKQL
ncbi:3-phosphoshikimate 1-carboxyvinyltransferase [Oceanotoga teriensis]|uniref:3-phosphoshikimate 1-carboxyvinyltransferase n=1 Tax=Oceanotoga teriensis TaxID=515440 RepID=UPI0027144A1D|nr:3-phosphoshikimate 1-carboxyvinyltransferase [Oceanotoga teriensis]MDO7976840.1 3-phosphoshikimate 1-carboxyvinyltransferase [Oceanotoga teriensis]